MVYEPRDGWSLQNLRSERGDDAVDEFHRVYPGLQSMFYDVPDLDLEPALAGADVVIVHEWNDRDLVRRLGQHRKQSGQYRLFFHDTHHRAITAPSEMAAYDLSCYDGVLVFGVVIRELYIQRGWTQRAWTWHEAADTRVFRPIAGRARQGDLVWIGNWGDEERSAELHEFLIGPVRRSGLSARVHGVRYPDYAKVVFQEAGITYAGWVANYDVPEVLARFALTVHIPRRPSRCKPGGRGNCGLWLPRRYQEGNKPCRQASMLPSSRQAW